MQFSLQSVCQLFRNCPPAGIGDVSPSLYGSDLARVQFVLTDSVQHAAASPAISPLVSGRHNVFGIGHEAEVTDVTQDARVHCRANEA